MAGPPDDDLVGKLLGGKYQVQKLIGTGGMGSVYKAENTWTRRTVAIKVLSADYIERPAFVQRFMLEAQAASRVAHPHIVDILDLAQEPDGGPCFIVQEFLTGDTLRRHIGQQGRF